MAGFFDPLNQFLSPEAIAALNTVVADAAAGEIFTPAEKVKLDSITVSNGNVAQSTGATPVTLAVVAIPLNTTLFLEVKLAGTRDNFTQGAAYVSMAAFRNQAGVVTAVQDDADIFIAEDDPSWAGPTYAIAGTNVLQQAAAKAGVIVNWVSDISSRQA